VVSHGGVGLILAVLIAGSSPQGAPRAEPRDPCKEALANLKQSRVSVFAAGCDTVDITREITDRLAALAAAAYRNRDPATLERIAAFIGRMFNVYFKDSTPFSRNLQDRLYESLERAGELGAALELPRREPRGAAAMANGLRAAAAKLRQPAAGQPFRPVDYQAPSSLEAWDMLTAAQQAASAAVAFSLLSAVALLGCVAFVYVRHRQLEATLAEEKATRGLLAHRLESAGEHPPQTALLERLESEVGGLRQQVEALASDLTARREQETHWQEQWQAKLMEFRTEVVQLQTELDDLRPRLVELQADRGLSWGDLVAIELEALRAGWQRYRDQQPRAASLAEGFASDPRSELISCDLLTVLPRAVGADQRLRAACESLLELVRDHYNFGVRASHIPALLKADPKSFEKDPARALMNIRDRALVLAILQTGGSRGERLSFDLEKWIREQFLSFADLFFQVYQQARAESATDGLAEGRDVVLKILKVVGLEPIEIELGQTLFDSSKHIGRSTAYRPEMRDGTIAGVVRNGFRQVGGAVVQQPEVIVNRV
jgi:hypothetical protein